MTARTLASMTLACLMLAASVACDTDDAECADHVTLADCESDADCVAGVAWPVAEDGTGLWIPDCDAARLTRCSVLADDIVLGVPARTWCGYPPDDSTRLHATIDIVPLPETWTGCTDELLLPGIPCP